MAKAVKLADIAERVGVSVVTVSKALSGQKGVSDEMRERIEKLANELGYVQPSVAKRKAQQASYNIGVLIQESYLDRYASFYWQMYQHVARHTVERGSFTLLEVVTVQMEQELELPKLLLEDKVDGVIVIGTLSETYLRKLTENETLPVVFMDFIDEQRSADSVISDSFYGAYYITNYLFDMGHTRIAYVGTLLSTGSITDRYLGYCKSLMEHGQDINPDWIIKDRAVSSGLIDEEAMLQLPEKMPSAFFCNCDLTAGMLIRKLEREGYRVPEDISVVGYDNYIHPGLCDVEITSYEVNMSEMAGEAVDILLKKIGHENYRTGIHIIEGRLIEKASVKKLN